MTNQNISTNLAIESLQIVVAGDSFEISSMVESFALTPRAKEMFSDNFTANGNLVQSQNNDFKSYETLTLSLLIGNQDVALVNDMLKALNPRDRGQGQTEFNVIVKEADGTEVNYEEKGIQAYTRGDLPEFIALSNDGSSSMRKEELTINLLRIA